MSRVLRPLLVALAAAAGIALIVVLAWGIDLRVHHGEAMRGVRLGDTKIAGMTRPEVTRVVHDLAAGFDAARIRVSAPGGGFQTDAGTLGVSVAERATVDSVMHTGRTGPPLDRLFGWIRSVFTSRPARLRVRVDVASVYRTVRENDPGPRTEPTEPKLDWQKNSFRVVDGENGKGIDPRAVLAALPKAAADGAPFVVTVDRGKVEPRWSKDDVERLKDRAEELIDEPLPVKAGDTTAKVPVATARSWVSSEATDDGLRLVVDHKAALAGLATLLKDAGTPATETRFAVEGGGVVIVPGKDGTKCCAADAADEVENALLIEGDPGASVELALTKREPRITEDEARALKIVEPVGAFTTRHKAGEPRVTNIHRIADIVRGEVIEPGDTFSVNKTVGKRTTEKGFVTAPVIENGLHSEDVGGGISQFATTLFNAAFFAGLDFGEYQSHSLVISRYPYGREATMGYPHPDLQIKNTTPYGVLIWPTYTADSITITLYSTKYVNATQTGQTKTQRGNCTRVSTERTRTYLDGHVDVDHVFATYRPDEGVNC